MIIRDCRTEDHERLKTMTMELVDLMSHMDQYKRFLTRDVFNAHAYVTKKIDSIGTDNGKILVAEEDGEIIGYLAASYSDSTKEDSLNKVPFREGSIDDLYVNEAHRSKGVSTALLKEIESYFREMKCDYSTIGCLGTNTAARSLYAKNGYNEQYIDYFKKL
jgi:ribosomal protein S18 acetylase RimI-like enzyme